MKPDWVSSYAVYIYTHIYTHISSTKRVVSFHLSHFLITHDFMCDAHETIKYIINLKLKLKKCNRFIVAT